MPQWLAAMKVASVTVAAFAGTNEAWRVLSSGVVRLQVHPVPLMIPAISSPLKVPHSSSAVAIARIRAS